MKDIIDKLEFKPLKCSWEITLECNFECIHCGSSAGMMRSNELDTDEAIRLCSDLSSLGCKEVALLGGEPFVRKDWYKIAEKLKHFDISVNIVSNGFLIDEEKAKVAKSVGVNNIGISIDGLEQTHNVIRRNPQSFSKCFKAIEILQNLCIPFCVVTTITKMNYSELEKMEELFCNLGIKNWQIQLALPQGRLSLPRNRKTILEPEQIKDVLQFIFQVRKRNHLNIYTGCNLGYYTEIEETIRPMHSGGLDFWTGCYAGILLVGIKSNGDVVGCLTMGGEFVEGNIRKKSFQEIWNNPNGFKITRQFHTYLLKGFCAQCAYGEICRGGCPMLAYSITGSPFNNPYCLYRFEREKSEKIELKRRLVKL